MEFFFSFQSDLCIVEFCLQDQSAEALPTLPAVPSGEIAEDFVLPEVPQEKLKPSRCNCFIE